MNIVLVLIIIESSHAKEWFEDSKALEINSDIIPHTLSTSNQDKHYIVEFFSENCKFWVTLKPTWDQLAEEFNDKSDIVIATINSNKNRGVASKFGINAYVVLTQIIHFKEC